MMENYEKFLILALACCSLQAAAGCCCCLIRIWAAVLDKVRQTGTNGRFGSAVLAS